MNHLIYTPSVQRQADNLMQSYKISNPSATRAEIVRVCTLAVRLTMRMEAEKSGFDYLDSCQDNLHGYTFEFYKEMIQYLNAQL